MSDEDWETGFAKSLGIFLYGEGIKARGPQGERIVDDTFYVLFNAHQEEVGFMMPHEKWGLSWSKVLDTGERLPVEKDEIFETGQEVAVQGRSVVLFMRVG